MDEDYKRKQMQPPNADGTPFSEPDDVPDMDDTDPQTDTNIDADEAYQHGLREAAHPVEPENQDSDDDPPTNDQKLA